MIPIKDFPKIKSPFVRKVNEAGHYVVTSDVEEGMEWVFNDRGVCAVDKLHGTNCCVHISDKHLDAIDNRTTRIMQAGLIPTRGMACKFIIGAMNACNRWEIEDGSHFGELIGPDINGNMHRCLSPLFVPFNYLRSKCHWHSWVQNKYPKDFSSISDWFKDLTSLFTKRIFGTDILTEGLIFYHPDGRMAKLRRDMFDWFFINNPEAKSHKDG